MAGATLNNISKCYEQKMIFHGINLKIYDGECFTLLGPSGCGKTVLLRLIAGFEQPTSGSLSIGDQLMSSVDKNIRVPTDLRNIGVVFQDYAVWPHKTVFENIIYPLQMQRIDGQSAKFRTNRMLDLVNLNGLEARYPAQLSGGQQQRVALARALIADPDLMLLDEPLTNLDANLREEMCFEIKSLQRTTGLTLFYVTHDQQIALALSDRMAIMDSSGNIRQIGTPIEIYEHPKDAFVFSFMGISNFIPVEVRDSAVFVSNSQIVLTTESFPDPQTTKKQIAGFRPSDVELSHDRTEVVGTVLRSSFLGSIIDTRIKLGDMEIRVQQDTREALEKKLMFGPGETCNLRFHNIKWFEIEETATNV